MTVKAKRAMYTVHASKWNPAQENKRIVIQDAHEKRMISAIVNEIHTRWFVSVVHLSSRSNNLNK